MRIIALQTELPTAADRVWDAMRSPATFFYVCRGLFGVPALAGRVERFRVGECGTRGWGAFHVLPAYCHTIEVDAGPMTSLLAPFVAGILRYRQRRWRKLVNRHLLPGGPVYARRNRSPR